VAETKTIHRGPYPELTWHALLVGYGLGVIIAISIGYASLKLGFSIEGSELAAILGWGILRGLMKRTSILENNINQTIASAVNGASAGMMFSVPALFILAKDYPGVTSFSRTLMVFACIAGGVVGLCFVIPLRKQMIDFNRLAYPGGIAVAAILKSPGAGMRKAMILLGGAVVSGLVHAVVLLVEHLEASGGWNPAAITGQDLALGAWLGLPPYLNVTFSLSVMTIGVGFLSGRGGLWFGAGGFLCYWILAPLLARFGSESALDVVARGPGQLKDVLFRPTGIGILIGAAVGSIFFAAPLIKSAIKSMQDAAKQRSQGGRASDEMPIGLLYAGVAAGTLVLILVTTLSVSEMTLVRAIPMALLGVLWVWIAGVIVSECLGRTNWSPLSGMTLIAVTILILVAGAGEGIDKPQMIVSSVIMGAAVCVAIAQAGDMMLDLKSGYLVGASPRKQQIGQFLGTWLGPIVIITLIFVLHGAYELGSDSLPAPQGAALASMVSGVLGGDVPVFRYAAGAGMGLLVAFSGLGSIGVLLGLGFYMPFSIVLTYTIGNFLRIASDRFQGRKFVEDVGIPLAAGLIVGEALVGVGNALVRVVPEMFS